MAQMLQRLSSPEQTHYRSIQFTYWLQWHLFRQLRAASEYAQQHSIALKGDLPIGAHVHSSSCASWNAHVASRFLSLEQERCQDHWRSRC
jgi:4-alpha-glucanotransferase